MDDLEDGIWNPKTTYPVEVRALVGIMFIMDIADIPFFFYSDVYISFLC